MSDLENMFSLKGKTIIVTGGTKRYGNCFCEGLAEAGGTIIVTSRDLENAEKYADGFRSNGYDMTGYALDQGDDASIEQLIDRVIDKHGRIDALINNARTIPRNLSREELDRTFSVNDVGLILITRRVVEEMKKTGGGNIINIGSIYGLGGQDLGIYAKPEGSMSWDYPIHKGGAIIFTKQLATTLARHGIRSNCLSLGGLDITVPDDETFRKGYLGRTPLGRYQTAEDVKGPIVFLASDASAYMTGANLVIDGGWSSW